MTIEAAAPAIPAEGIQTQNLFEHAAANAQGLSQGAGPQQLGSEVMQNLQGYIERSGSLAERTNALVQQPAGSEMVSLSSGPMNVPAQPDAPAADDSKMDRAIESLSLMFDHAIETQLVVRGATQVAGAANTLLRGQ